MLRPCEQQVDIHRTDERQAQSRRAGRQLPQVVRHRWLRRRLEPEHDGDLRSRQQHVVVRCSHDCSRGRRRRGSHPLIWAAVPD